jgi:hypothetical protein
MTTIRFWSFVAVARLVAAFFIAGCAPSAHVITPTAEQVRITVYPMKRPVRLVGKKPPSDRYVFLGRISGVATDSDFVDAANHARESLFSKAEAIGADVVRIVRPTLGRHRVLLAGLAYRRVE